jgi:hypothetical protein
MNTNTQSFPLRHLLVAALCCMAGASQATIAVSPATTPATFSTSVSGSTDTFSNLTLNGLVGLGMTSMTRSAGTLGYGVTTQTDFYVVPVAGSIGLSVGDTPDTLTFSSFATPIFAFGANFFATNILGEATSVPLTVVIKDVNNLTSTQSLTASAFRGFVSDVALLSVVVSVTTPGTGPGPFVSVDNVVLSAVPEASSWLMMALGGAAVLAIGARRRA